MTVDQLITIVLVYERVGALRQELLDWTSRLAPEFFEAEFLPSLDVSLTNAVRALDEFEAQLLVLLGADAPRILVPRE